MYGFWNEIFIMFGLIAVKKVLKVRKYQKHIFSKNRMKLFFDVCPKDLKWVKKKDASIILNTP